MLYIISVVSCAALLLLDRITKGWAVEQLKPVGSRSFIPGFIELRYHTNDGAAFGMLQGMRWIFVVFAVAVLAAGIYYFIKLPHTRVYHIIRAGMTLVIAGALGNAMDRVLNGYVVDFLNFEFISFPIFNVADICIVCGTVLLSVMLIFFVKDGPTNGGQRNDA